MAERRMFAKTIIDSDAFLEMPLSTQALYFHLGMRADDEGFLNNARKIMRMIGASEDEMKVLISKRFVILFESGVIVIKHWKIHNYIQTDRFKETLYTEERKKLKLKDNKGYSLDTKCIQDGYTLETQVSIGKDSIEEVSIGKDKSDGKPPIPPLPSDEEFEKIWYEELTKRANKMNQQVWEFFDKTLSDSLLYDFTEYCKKIYPTKDRYKDYSAAARTWQGRDIKKLKSYNKKVESPQDQIEHKINYDYSHTYDNIKQWREIRPKNWKKIIVTDLCRIYNRDIFEQVANMEHLKSVDDPEVYINSIIEVMQ